MKTIDPYVHEFIVAESTLRFQTNKRKPALLSQNIQDFSPSIQRKTSISVTRKLINCPRNLKGFSTRCFQQQQRYQTLKLFLQRSSYDLDIAIVSDVDEIPKPYYLNRLRHCNIDTMILKAHQFKFGTHCDSGVSWYEGPKIYSRHWLQAGNFSPVTFDNLRRRSPYSLPYVENAAWHLTSFGNEYDLYRKLTSFTAANLFTTQKSLDVERLKRCTDNCYELLYRGKPLDCNETWMPKVGKRLTTISRDLPPILLKQRSQYPISWFSGLTHDVTVITSMTSKASYTHQPVFKTTKFYDIVVYFNGMSHPKQLERVTYRNVSERQPWVETFINNHTHYDSAIQQFYKKHKKFCVVRPYVNVCNDVYSVFKVGAIVDALIYDSTNIIWLDADSYIRKYLDEAFFAFTSKYQISTIGRKNFYPETGVIVFNRHKPTEYWKELKSFYTETTARNSINDIVLFHIIGASMGWLAADCAHKLAHRNEIVGYQAKDLFCPREHINVSVFHVFDYIIHRKHSDGLIHKSKKNIKH